jgi:V8-like Glu-specific endopeptidase
MKKTCLILAVFMWSGITAVAQTKPRAGKSVLTQEPAGQMDAIVSELERRSIVFNLSRIGLRAYLPGEPIWRDKRTSELLLQLQQITQASDDRHEVFEAPNTTGVNRNIAATAAVFPDRSIRPASGDSNDWRLSGGVDTVGFSYGLCNGERFAKQKAPSSCTAFLVAPQVVATAAHCVRDSDDLRNLLFVFGFDCTSEENCRDTFNVCNIYQGIAVERKMTGNVDWALVKLDRTVVGRDPVIRRTSGTITSGTKLYMVGHAAGGPTKYINNGRLLTLMSDSFTADLDGFEHNSGSPVFNEATDELEGIFITAGDTFAPRDDKQCNITVVCGEACPAVAMSVAELPAVAVVGTKPVCP